MMEVALPAEVQQELQEAAAGGRGQQQQHLQRMAAVA
jgi:hypothetical protein